MLYQQDPIGLAGGLNLYGFANGDPVNFSDPFGLCPDPPCDEDEETTGQRIKRAFDVWVANKIDTGLEVLGGIGNWIRANALRIVAEEAVVQAALPAIGTLRHGRRVAAVADDVGRFLTENRHLRNAAAAQHDWAMVGLSADDVVQGIARNSGWQGAGRSLMEVLSRVVDRRP